MTPGYFSYEIHRPPRWNTFLVGLAINAAGILFLAGAAPHFSTVETRSAMLNRPHVTLVAPTFEHPDRIPEPPQVARIEAPRLVPVPPLRVEPPKAPRSEPKQIESPKVEQAKPPVPKPEAPKFESPASELAIAKPAPAKAIKTNVFSASPSETATTTKQPRQVQTGGFGDPNGVAGQADPKSNAVVTAHLGSFELPAGSGNGNGTDESHGVGGTVRSAGFNDGGATANAPRSNRTVAASGFHEVVAKADEATVLQRGEQKPQLQPVEILFKPRPAYTAEARRRKVEGEVLLDVVFAASGALRINRVVKGLGYGLDDNALVAAQHIQFRPARRDGQPYDYAALVHIVFELSE